MRHWSWLMKLATGTLALNANSFTVPADVNGTSIEGIWFQDATGVQIQPVQFLDPVKLFKLRFDTPQTGAPMYWTFIGSTIHVYPTADAAYTYNVLYSSTITVLVADIDVPVIPEEYDEILVWGALARAAFRQNNWLTRDYADQQRVALVNRMMAAEEMNQRQNPDEVEQTGIWQSPDPLRDFWSWR